MQLYFIRHAQSTHNALWAQTGSEASALVMHTVVKKERPHAKGNRKY